MLKINISKQAEKFLLNTQPKHAKQIARKIKKLQLDPKLHGTKNLTGEYSYYRRATSGEYRIVYYDKSGTLYVDLIGKRNDSDVYKLLERKNK